jgi:outer membrane protein assembly factor BamB
MGLLGAVGAREVAAAAPQDDRAGDSAVHPLVVEFSKPGYNVYAAVQAVLADGAEPAACQLITATDVQEEMGLLPDLTQTGLYVPYATFVTRFLQDRPTALEYMRQRFSALAELRVTAASEDQDEMTVASAAVQFCGTRAATQAGLWLGDRALAGGDFVQAACHYRRAWPMAVAADRAALDQRLQLAGAMQGRPAEAGPEQTISYGGLQLSADEFRRLLREMTAQHRPDMLVGGLLGADLPVAPLPMAWDAKPCGRDELPGGRGGEGGLDWGTRVLAGVGTDTTLYLSNRWLVLAIDLLSGKQRWEQLFGQPRNQPPREHGTPCRPLLAGERILVRRLSAKDPPAVSCLDARQGRVLWTSDAKLYVASDPWLQGDRVWALTLEVDSRLPRASWSPPSRDWRRGRAAPHHLRLHWTAFQLDNGNLACQCPLLSFRGVWKEIPSSRAAIADDKVVATFAGVTFGLDLDGRLQWVRKHVWDPATNSERRSPLFHALPLIAHGRVAVAQPGSPVVQCLDVATGALVWEYKAADLRRLLGVVDGRLLLQTDQGLAGISWENGQALWRRPLTAPHETLACGAPGGLLCLADETEPSGETQTTWLWIDPTDGHVTARQPLAELLASRAPSKAVVIGPLWHVGERLLVGVERRGYPRKDRELYELLPARSP